MGEDVLHGTAHALVETDGGREAGHGPLELAVVKDDADRLVAQQASLQVILRINFIFVDNLNRYRDTLSNESFSDAHLALIPYDRKDSIPTTKSFSFQKDIKTEYDNFLSNITSDSKITFLPFSIDPMIMYVLS